MLISACVVPDLLQGFDFVQCLTEIYCAILKLSNCCLNAELRIAQCPTQSCCVLTQRFKVQFLTQKCFSNSKCCAIPVLLQSSLKSGCAVSDLCISYLNAELPHCSMPARELLCRFQIVHFLSFYKTSILFSACP